MTWVDAAPDLGAAVAVLLLPGALTSAIAGLRGLLLAAVAPVISVAVIAAAAVAAELVGVRFGLLPVIVMAVLTAAVVGVARWIGHRTLPTVGTGRHTEPENGGEGDGDGERSVTGYGLVGAAIGAAFTAVGMARGIGRPEHWPQQFDAVFHLSAVERILESGDGSALTLGTLSSPGQAHAFYPAAWHDVAGLVGLLTGSAVPVIANAVAVVVAGLVWSLGCVALTRAVVGSRPGVLLTAGVLSAGLAASPIVLSAYGTLWPNALATALLPASLALVADLCALGGPRTVPLVPGAVLLVGAIAGLGLAHPNAVVTLLVVGAAALVVGTWARGPRWRAATLALSALVTYLLLWSPAFDGQRGISWPHEQTLAQAAGEWASLAPQRLPIPFLLAALVLVGCLVAARSARTRWVLAVHGAAGVLFVLIAGSDGALSSLVGAAWWDDPFRPAALAGLAGVPLAALGLEQVTRWIAASRARGLPAVAHLDSPILVGLAVVAAIVVAGLQVPKTGRVMERWFASSEFLGPEETALLERLPSLVDPGERVVGDPWNGASLTGPLGDREAVFPHLTGGWDPDRTLVARSLSSAGTRPDVCAALDRLEVEFVLTNRARFWLDDPRRENYRGLDVAGIPGFVAVDRGGGATLWQITACGP